MMACMNFIILKVNGIDVSNFPHEDAVQVFLNAPEPIVVELKRRSSGMDSLNSSTTSSSRSSDATNSVKNQAATQLVTTAVQTEVAETYQEHFLYDESPVSDHPDDECLPPDIDIEEITLRKTKSDERIGLMVSYSSANGSGSDDTETCTEVFINDIIPESVAARDGRLRQGDQILQVNGRDVTTKEETESLFAENKNAVTLLVSRCMYSGEDDLLDGEEFFEEDFPPPPPSLLAAAPPTVEMRTSTTSEKDSGFDSNRLSGGSLILGGAEDPLNHRNIKAQMEAVNQEIAELNHRVENAFKPDLTYRQPADTHREEPKVTLASPRDRKPPTFPTIPPPMDSDTEHIYETIPEDSEPEPIYTSPYEASDQSMVEQWLKMNGINGQKVVLRKVARSPQQESKVWQKTTKSNSSGEDHENSSSAYNTGGSCNSNHLTLELNFSPDKDMSRSTMVLCPQKPKEKKVNGLENGSKMASMKIKKEQKVTSPQKQKHGIPNSSSNHLLTSPGSHHAPSSSQPGTPMSPMGGQFIIDLKEKMSKTNTNPLPTNTMYTNMANLQQTIVLQQRMFRQQMTQQNTISNVKHYTAPNLSQYQFVSGQQVYRTSLQPRTNEENMVWKVKRRPDGTRYIVRRPVNRTKILKERAIKIAEERNELTTEDDTVSEIKLGRCWTKEERKKHMEKAKERRHRQEAMIAAKNQQLQETNGVSWASPVVNGLPPTIPKSKSAESQHRRASMIRRKNNNKEDFVPEMEPKSMLMNGKVGLLSVTTV